MDTNFDGRCSIMDSVRMPVQYQTITHQLFQAIKEMPEDEERSLLKLLNRGVLKGRCWRQHFRKPIHMPVRYTSKDGLSSGVVRDISLGGVFILSRDVVSLGERLAMFFSHANFDKTVWITGDVIRVTSEGIGVRFGSMNENQKRAFLCIAYTQ